jgi:hypothetical protein
MDKPTTKNQKLTTIFTLIITFLVFFILNMSMNVFPSTKGLRWKQKLFYRPKKTDSILGCFATYRPPDSGTVENIGVEPMTSCVQGRRSSQLS